MTKMFSIEMATRVIDRVMQVHGGMGITSEIYFTGAWQTVRTVQIADGSAEILRRVVRAARPAGSGRGRSAWSAGYADQIRRDTSDAGQGHLGA